MMAGLKNFLLAAGLCAVALPLAAAELVMVQQRGCAWCAAWDEQIAPAYPHTDEGKFAPLRRIELKDLPGDLTLRRNVTFTPTFLVVEDDTEIARLEGYPGEDFFWPVLARLLTTHTDFKGDTE